MAAHLSKDQWHSIRVAWEEKPEATYESAAEEAARLGRFNPPTKGRVCQLANKQGWIKRRQLSDINESAHRRADAAPKVNPKVNEINDKDQELNPYSPERIAAREESEMLRAEIFIRHRKEWEEMEGFRRSALAAMKRAHDVAANPTADEVVVKGAQTAWASAKLAAETARTNLSALDIKQQGERRAWGLDHIVDPAALRAMTDEQLEALTKGKGV